MITLSDRDLREEQQFVSTLYRRLDQMRDQTTSLRDAYLRDSDGTPGGRVQRDIAYAHHAATLQSLVLAEDRLCFGRLDTAAGESVHIGRLGIFEEGPGDRQLLMDWRAPSARPFYVATAADPLGLVRRRHLRVRRRVVGAVTDEYLDVRPELLARLGVETADVARADSPAGESALLAALNAPRTGRMADIVETIQGEQDAIIRADRSGVLVVQGGPGTGKTAVALHRVAYLLYNHRDQLANRGVLIIGPNRTFLEYIGQVLPSLGENAVVLSTLGELVPGVRAEAVDEPEVAAVKGRAQMAGVIANAVLDRQRMPRVPVPVPSAQGRLELSPELLARAQRRAWGGRAPHNRARASFLRVVFNDLARQVAARHRRGLGAELPWTAEDAADTVTALREDEAVHRALAPLWPLLTPAALLRDLLSDPRRLAFAAPDLQERQRAALLRPASAPFTVSDVPLLDEAAELLGPLPADRGPGPADDGAARDYAETVLDMLAGEEAHEDAEAAGDTASDGTGGIVDAATLLALQADRVALTSTAERAATDREWTYGHVVVDEAQELSPMAWRAVMRRCPLRSMTLVGDTAQASDPAAARSWARALRPHVGDRWRLAELTVNYRTPGEISDLAERVLRRIDPGLRAPTAVRRTGVRPWFRRVPAEKLTAVAAQSAAEELAQSAEGRLAVLVPPGLRAAAAAAVAAGLDRAARERVDVLTVAEAKGLEFDVVLLVDPDAIERGSRRGRSDVYVAITRATQRLGVLHSGPTPAWAAD
ncbi:HelD family protein [Nakamurella endophytica]|uniref:DNA helicase n=1 Tax=Nakamurella endophytica TaxID=1748367 RepID=A0A917SR31_9ACTN|nr:AAA family ATPase [Nakamurella endophytica]GGL92749.1 DNA helicase [Nakamurella endophytica]